MHHDNVFLHLVLTYHVALSPRNTSCSHLCMHKGHIHSIAGPELELECQRVGFTAPGDAKTTKVLTG